MIRRTKPRLGALIGAVLLLSISLHAQSESPGSERATLNVAGLNEPVEIMKDRWGISHIYAETQWDLFFAQGFSVARDRLFQLELWRRRATGTFAEVAGLRALKRDIGARLLRARVDMKKEMRHYHPDGDEIIPAFCAGINAYIDLTEARPELLPMEFGLLGIKPGRWSPEIVVSRHNGLYRNVTNEPRFARAVSIIGEAATTELLGLEPGDPQIVAPEGLDLGSIPAEALALYSAARRSMRFRPEDIADPAARARDGAARQAAEAWIEPDPDELLATIGSNNWVLSGEKTYSRSPIMANDPHRGQQVPSLRYWAHLVGPGWNVIGGGEPALPGLSIGHNEHGAWGLTVFAIDQEDLYVYETDPENPNRYRYGRGWDRMRVETERIAVKGLGEVSVELKFTRHGPVLYEDALAHRAYALRAAWLEVGGAPYLASLRIDQASTWKEFRDACSYSHTPSENMIWADRKGNIGWQVVGIAPRRSNWLGLLPVPGHGSHEWDGFIPIRDLPHLSNPPSGFFGSANENNVPAGYPNRLGMRWSDAFRVARIDEVLGQSRRFTLMDNVRLQTDELSIPARTLAPMLRGLAIEDDRARAAAERLADWDFVLDKDSVAAGIFMAWQRKLRANARELFVPEAARAALPAPSMTMVIDWLTTPDGRFGADPLGGRDALLIASLGQAVTELTEKLGDDMAGWRYGQADYHHVLIAHPLSAAVNDELRAKLNVGPLPRGGSSYTLNNTGSGNNQTSGPSLRIIADTADWDRSLGTNNPGQSGRPGEAHYSDLFAGWASGRYFPVLYSREKVEGVAEERLDLVPKR